MKKIFEIKFKPLYLVSDMKLETEDLEDDDLTEALLNRKRKRNGR